MIEAEAYITPENTMLYRKLDPNTYPLETDTQMFGMLDARQYT